LPASRTKRRNGTATNLWRSDILVMAALLLITLAIYQQVRNFEFLSYDDPRYVTENLHVRAGFTMASFAWAFTSVSAANWFPVTWLSHIADYRLFGLESGWHHLTNVVIHSLSVLLLFVFLKRATGALWPSALVAFCLRCIPCMSNPSHGSRNGRTSCAVSFGS
jgi:hypothetical protein